ncbi:MAG: ImmA/IrrE family metallo-endopeptidase [Polyangiaceae bacterium]
MADLAREALIAARRVRVASHTSAESPFCIFDLVQGHYRDQIDLRFQAAPSMEGLYVRGDGQPSLIILSSLRPDGRQRMTCAHELGHHEFGHGTSLDALVDEQGDQRFDPTEFLADSFACFLLMPKLAMLKAFAERGIRADSASPFDIYRVACVFGVGYASLVQHLSRSLGMLSAGRAAELRRTSPKEIREQILGIPTAGALHVVDAEWRGRAIDLHVGEHVLLPQSTLIEGDNIEHRADRMEGGLYEAVRPGISRIEHHATAMANYVRVSRAAYEGRAMFRHEEDCDE